MDACHQHSGILAQLDALCKKMDIRFEAQDKALNTATKEMDRRLEAMNEFRKQLDIQADAFATKIEVRSEVNKINIKLDAMLRREALQEGSSRWSDYLIMVGIASAIALLSKLLHV